MRLKPKPLVRSLSLLSLTAGLVFGSLDGAAAAPSGSITVEFKVPEGKATDFKEVNVYLIEPDTARDMNAWVKFKSTDKKFKKKFEGLKKGDHALLVFTGSWDQIEDASRPGAFRTVEQVTLEKDNEAKAVEVVFDPFDLTTVKGSETGKIVVTEPSGKPVPDFEISVVAPIESAGSLVLGKGKTKQDGSFEVTGLAKDATYAIQDADDSPIGTLETGKPATLTVPPQVGSMAPDIEFVVLADGKTKKLSDFRGKVVVLDFWASWCGPCQAPMANMQTYREKHPEWGDKVELITLSLDQTKEAAVEHLKKKKWDRTYNTWAGEAGGGASAPRAFAITGIPTVFVISAEGKVTASGNPMVVEVTKLVSSLLKK